MKVTITKLPKDSEARETLAVFRAIFPQLGQYQVDPLPVPMVVAKAAGPEGGGDFETWFLQALFERSRAHYVNAREAIWEVLDGLLTTYGVPVPSGLELWELHQALFDLSMGSTARMVGLSIPKDLTNRLTAMKFRLPEVLDFPALAYRMGLIYERLQQSGPLEWGELVSRAKVIALSTAEQAAVQYARQHSGLFLKPIFDDAGRVWAIDRELAPLRTIVGDALETRQGAKAAARELGNSQRARGIFRDAERVIRTEMAENRSRGSWMAEAGPWPPETLVFRHTSTTPCVVCLRLYKLPNGTPRLYTKVELEVADARGINEGPQDGWHARIGPTHPNCVCSPWQRYHAAMDAIFAKRAPEFAAVMRRLKVFAEAA